MNREKPLTLTELPQESGVFKRGTREGSSLGWRQQGHKIALSCGPFQDHTTPSACTIPLPPTVVKDLGEIVREFSQAGSPRPDGEMMVLYDDFVDLLVVASPRYKGNKIRSRQARLACVRIHCCMPISSALVRLV